eukprot:Seg3562.11 transcript_id=Seg3562.11/GoldUCD/mRNA.D3Y31 product="putative transposon-derived protein F54H12.3" protein_id=Seg3562.11/GoldUCD/D3Y31
MLLYKRLSKRKRKRRHRSSSSSSSFSDDEDDDSSDERERGRGRYKRARGNNDDYSRKQGSDEDEQRSRNKDENLDILNTLTKEFRLDRKKLRVDIIHGPLNLDELFDDGESDDNDDDTNKSDDNAPGERQQQATDYDKLPSEEGANNGQTGVEDVTGVAAVINVADEKMVRKGHVKSSNNISNRNLHTQLSALYRDSSFPGAFSSTTTFFKHARKKIPQLTLKKVHEWREHDMLVAKRSRITRPKIRRSVQVFNPSQIWEGDLVDMSKSNIRLNRNVRYLLLLIDQFTKKLYCAPIFGGNKSGPNVIKAFKQIFSNTTSRPKFLYSDNGGEFIAKDVKAYLLNTQHIKTITTQDKEVKASMVERAIRTLKGRLFTFINSGNPRYLNKLQDIINGINETAGRVTNVAPNNVDPISVGTVRNNIYNYNKRQENKFRKRTVPTQQQEFFIKKSNTPPTPKYQVGDFVIIKKERQLFRKEHEGQWNDEIFQIASIASDTIPFVYHVKDLAGELLQGYFNEQDINRIQLPSYLPLEKTTAFHRRIFTSPQDNSKYIEVKIDLQMLRRVTRYLLRPLFILSVRRDTTMIHDDDDCDGMRVEGEYGENARHAYDTECRSETMMRLQREKWDERGPQSMLSRVYIQKALNEEEKENLSPEDLTLVSAVARRVATESYIDNVQLLSNITDMSKKMLQRYTEGTADCYNWCNFIYALITGIWLAMMIVAVNHHSVSDIKSTIAQLNEQPTQRCLLNTSDATGKTCCCTINYNHSSSIPELRDEWKEHICDSPCMNCHQLVLACAQFNAQGACTLYNNRCHNMSEAARREHNVCEPGCLNCGELRDGCYRHGDPAQCITYNDYCRINADEKTSLNEPPVLLHTDTVLNILTDIPLTHIHSSITCVELDKQCIRAQSFSDYLACLYYIIRCKKIPGNDTKDLLHRVIQLRKVFIVDENTDYV